MSSAYATHSERTRRLGQPVYQLLNPDLPRLHDRQDDFRPTARCQQSFVANSRRFVTTSEFCSHNGEVIRNNKFAGSYMAGWNQRCAAILLYSSLLHGEQRRTDAIRHKDGELATQGPPRAPGVAGSRRSVAMPLKLAECFWRGFEIFGRDHSGPPEG